MASEAIIPPQSAQLDRQSRRARASGFIGSTMESYDFGLYAAAAGLVFPQVFFAGLSPELATTLSFVVLLSGYIARPLGGLIFGHLGDQRGRRNVLVVTLLLMGATSVGIGLIPGSSQIGVAAPIILVTLRVLQGIAYGGEYGGAVLMALESSPPNRRGLGASLAMAGGPFGAVLGALAFGLAALLPTDQLMSWGWRVPFLLSAVVVLIGLFIRRRLEESPEFAREVEAKSEPDAALPVAVVFGQYLVPLALGILAGVGALFVQGLVGGFMVPYVVKNSGIPRSDALFLLSLSYVAHTAAIPFFAWLSDKFGRVHVMAVGMITSAVLIWPVFTLFRSTSTVAIGLAFLFANALIQASMFGPYGAFLSEMFPTRARYTGLSLSFVVATVLGAGCAPLVAEQLVSGSDLTKLLVYLEVLIALGLIGVLASPRFRRFSTARSRTSR